MVRLSCFNLFLYKGDVVNVVGTTTHPETCKTVPIVRSEYDNTKYVAWDA